MNSAPMELVADLDEFVDDPEADVAPFYDSAHREHPAIEELRALYRFRDLVYQLIRCDIVSRYKRSYLGIVWTMLNPICTTLVLVVALAKTFGAPKSYAVHTLTGLMVWNFFTQGTVTAIAKALSGSRSLPSVYVPRTAGVVAAIGTALVNLVLATVPVIVLMLVCGVSVSSTVLLLPIPLFLLGVFATGVSLLVSSLSISFTDVAQIYNFALPAWMYITPVIYPAEVLSPSTRFWIELFNPLYPLVQLYRVPFTGGVIPSAPHLALAAIGTAITFAIGWVAFCSKLDDLGRIA